LPEKSAKVQFIGHYLYYYKNMKKTRFFLFWHIANFSVCFLCKVPEFFVEKRVLLTAAF